MPSQHTGGYSDRGTGDWNPTNILLSIPHLKTPGQDLVSPPDGSLSPGSVSPGGCGASGCGVQQDLLPSTCHHSHGDRGWGQESKALAIGGCGDPQSVSSWGHSQPCPYGDMGTSRAFPYEDTGTPETDPYREPRVPVPMGPQSPPAPQGPPEHPVLIPMGSCGPPKPPFHGDPPNLIPAGPRGHLSHPSCSSRARVSLSPWAADTARPGPGEPVSPHGQTGSPRGVPALRGDPRAHPAGRGLHPCPPYLLQPGTARRDTGTRGDGATSVLGVQTRPHRPSPPDSHWAPHSGACGVGPRNPLAPLPPPSPHHFFLSPLNPIEF